MKSVKNSVFNYLTPNQKTQICNSIDKFVKKHFGKSIDELFEAFIEEEQYYLDMNASTQVWIEEYLEDSTFLKDVKNYFFEIQRKYEAKERQKPFIEKQKAYLKTQRKLAQTRKMAKTPATSKQISYFKSLCRKFDIDKNIVNLDASSKLDLKEGIEILLSVADKTQKIELLKKLSCNNLD